MLRMLDLIYKILKYCLLLTLVRLLSTAFGWEFGVSRQYLRLLEWIFQVGQKRIEKVESENKLHKKQLEAQVDELPGDDVDTTQLAELAIDEESKYRQKRSRISSEGNDCNGCIGGTPIEEEPINIDYHDSNGRAVKRPNGFLGNSKQHLKSSTTITRRISTPDGPPVFLLDDYDDFNNSPTQNNGHSSQLEHCQHEFHLIDATPFLVKGISSIIDDQVTKRFTPEQLKTWNLLTRTNGKNYQFMSRSLGLCWLSGLLVRYSLLLPLRIIFTVTGFLWLILTMTLVGCLPSSLRTRPFRLLSLMSFRMLSCGITSRLAYHNRQYRAKTGDICVANHTSPLDVVLLACDNCYALVGQRHGGLLGLLEFALSRATNHVWFDRGEMRDRQLVTQRLRQHLSCKKNLPVLIFPEGTCINNSAVMMFRKGSFETTDRVCPVAIKYDARFGDPFWNSSKQSYAQYLLMMMSSWAIKCDVWYLPPMERLEGESSAEFANRVKAEIAKQGGLVDLAWDGQLKRSSIKPSWLHQQQEDYAKRLKLE